MIDLMGEKKKHVKRMRKLCKEQGCDWTPTTGQDYRINFRVCKRCGTIGWLM